MDQSSDLSRIPPRVEYTLTELAESFVPILEQMKEWSETHLC